MNIAVVVRHHAFFTFCFFAFFNMKGFLLGSYRAEVSCYVSVFRAVFCVRRVERSSVKYCDSSVERNRKKCGSNKQVGVSKNSCGAYRCERI